MLTHLRACRSHLGYLVVFYVPWVLQDLGLWIHCGLYRFTLMCVSPNACGAG